MPTELHYPARHPSRNWLAHDQFAGAFTGVRMPCLRTEPHQSVDADPISERETWLVVVDAGIATEAIRQAWQTIWADDSAAAPLVRMVVTHAPRPHRQCAMVD